VRRGFVYSLSLHVIAIILMYLGLPLFMHSDSIEEHAISVEVLPVSELTNIKPKTAAEKPKPKPDIKKPEPPKPKPPTPKPQPPKAEPKPVVKESPPPPPLPKPEAPKIVQKPVEKLKAPEPPKPEPKKKEPPKDDFASVLKSVEALKQPEEKPKEEKKSEDFNQIADAVSNMAKEEDYKPGLPMTMSEKDAIRQQIASNWNVVSGAKDAGNMVVKLKITLAIDGTVRNVVIVDQARYTTDAFFKATADSAVRAVLKSSPLKNLPPEKYDVRDGWRELELSFDPKDMFY
jgi:hypothetical protein